MSGALRSRGSVVDALSSALDRGGHGLNNVPVLLHRVLSDESWREFETVRGEVVRYERFTDFVTTPPLKGLGTQMELVRRIVCDAPETLDLLDRTMQGKQGRPSQKTDNVRDTDPNRHGNGREGALRRLRKDAPELHEEVLAGRLSAHAAMVKAGFRHRTVSVPVDQPESAAKALRRNLSPEDLATLRDLLA